jgi:hypothetical protein
MRGRGPGYSLACVLLLPTALALRPGLARGAERFTEAEHLLLLSGANGASATNYEEALGGRSVYLRRNTLRWQTDLPKGTYWLWIRARSGWDGDHTLAWSPKVLYAAKVDDRDAPLTARTETLVFVSDGHNFIWGRAGPLELADGRHEVELSCAWEWAHVDALLLTDRADFDPRTTKFPESTKPVTSTWSAWPTCPYADVDLLPKPPPEPLKEMATVVPSGGTAILAAAFHTHLGSKASTHFLTTLGDLKSPEGRAIPAAACRLYLVTYYRIRGGQVAADPLTPLSGLGAFSVAPGETAYLWLTVDTAGAKPGTYTGALTASSQFAYEDDKQSVPVRITVAEPALGPTKLSVFNWWGYSDASDEWWEMELRGGTNVFKAIVQHHVGFTFDQQGNLIGNLEFAELDKVVSHVKQADGQLLLEWYLHAPQFAGLTSRASAGAKPLEPFSPAWEKAFRTLVVGTRDHLLAQGLGYEQFAEYTYDENIGPDFIRAGKIIRDVDPKLRIFSDRTATLEEYKAAAPYIDIWCPHFGSLAGQAADGRLEFMRSTGKPIWAYDEGVEQRVRSPYVTYRLKFWMAWKYRLQGCTYWKFAGDDVGMVYEPSLPGGALTTSRRWEAWKKGLEDYKCLEALRAGGADADALDKAVEEVLATPGDPTLADRVIGRLLQRSK